MADLPLVSIGLPVYNAERHLAKALDSLLAQDYESFELIVSDNASTDSTQEICTSYAKRDSRLRYHRAEHNMGAIWNFNRVFELATGEYFMWAAHDDLRDPRYVSACLAAMQSHPAYGVPDGCLRTPWRSRSSARCVRPVKPCSQPRGWPRRIQRLLCPADR